MESTEDTSIFQSLIDKQNDIIINEKNLTIFVETFWINYYRNFTNETGTLLFPLKFSGLNDEINLISLHNLLSIGSNYEHKSSLANQSTLNDVIMFGLIGIFLTRSDINSDMMTTMNASFIRELFSIQIYERNKKIEEYHNLPIATIETRGEMADYADLLAYAMTSSGHILQARGHKDIASFVNTIQHRQVHESSSLRDAAAAISQILPYLDDREILTTSRIQLEKNNSNASNDQVTLELQFFKNARRLLYHVHNCHRRNTKQGEVEDVGKDWGEDRSLAAPSLRGISALFHLGILEFLSRTDTEPKLSSDGIGSGTSESSSETTGTPVRPVQSHSDRRSSLLAVFQGIKEHESRSGGGHVLTVMVRSAAILVCHRLVDEIRKSWSGATTEQGPGQESADKERVMKNLCPLTFSIFLDSLCEPHLPLLPVSPSFSTKW